MTNIKKLITIFLAVTIVAILMSLFQKPIDQPDIGLTQGGWIFLAVVYSMVASLIFWAIFSLLGSKKTSTFKVILISGFYSASVLFTFFALPESYGVFGLFVIMILYSILFSWALKFLKHS